MNFTRNNTLENQLDIDVRIKVKCNRIKPLEIIIGQNLHDFGMNFLETKITDHKGKDRQIGYYET